LGTRQLDTGRRVLLLGGPNQSNPVVSCTNHPSPTNDRYKFTANGRQPRQLARQVGAHRVSQRTSVDQMDGRIVLLAPGATLRLGSLGFVYTRPMESIAGRTFAWPSRPNVLTRAAGREAFVRGFSDEIIIDMLGPNPTQKRFRLAAYYLTDLAFQASGAEPLAWGEFMEWYTAMYPHRQPGLPEDLVTAYINNLHATGAAPGSTTTRRTRTTRQRDPMRECNVGVASASSSSELPTGHPSNRALYFFFTSPLCPSPCNYKRERRATVTRVRPHSDQAPFKGT
jgi:hypothetical protein